MEEHELKIKLPRAIVLTECVFSARRFLRFVVPLLLMFVLECKQCLLVVCFILIDRYQLLLRLA